MIEPAESSANLEDSGPRDPESLGKESQVREEKPVPTIEILFVDTDEYVALLAIMLVIFIGTAIFIIGAGFILLRK